MRRLLLSVGGTLLAFAILFNLLIGQAAAQDQTVGLFIHDSSAYDGYTLFAPNRAEVTYLIDMHGRRVHSWTTEFSPGSSVYLLENGHLLMPQRQPIPGGGGEIRELDWDGTVLWEYTYNDSTVLQHHDIEPMPNGNVLILAREFLSKEEAIENGRDTLLFDPDVVELWPEHVVEVEPIYPSGGTIVWEWHLWDHLIQDFDSTKANYGVVAEHPELMDINFALNGDEDWIHANSIEYNTVLDQIIISGRRPSEIWVIDHSTTTEEAASHSGGNSGMGGDLLYRWGNPISYRAGTELDQKLFYQHDAQWIAPGLPGAGNFLAFSNGGQGRMYSTVDEIESPVDGNGHYPQPSPGTAHGPTAASWFYIADPPGDFYATFISGAHRLPNGNTLICSGPQGRFFEVTSDREIVWEYINPVVSTGPVTQGEAADGNNVFRCTRIPADYPGLQGRDLTPGGPLELNPVSISGTSHEPVDPRSDDSVIFTALIAADSGLMVAELHADTGDGFVSFTLLDDGAHHDGLAGDSLYGVVLPPIPESTLVSYYIYTEDSLGAPTNDPPNPPATTYYFLVTPSFVCGDINSDEAGPDISDLVYLVDWMFTGGPQPLILEAADVDGSGGEVDISDLVYLVDFMFTGGPPPDCPRRHSSPPHRCLGENEEN